MSPTLPAPDWTDTEPVALVTGGTRGIGAAIADRLQSAGFRLLLTGTDPADIASRNASAPPTRRYLAADLSDAAQTAELADAIGGLPRLDVCVNNAGINIIKPLEEVEAADLDHLTAINYRGPYLICQAAARAMKPRRCGRIINIASIWSVITKPGRSLYAGAKAGLVGMTRALATDLASDGILVNAVSPGFVATDMTRRSLTEDQLARLTAEVPLGRLARPEEIAEVVAFLASPACTFMTGQNLVVDGGFTHV